MTKDKTVTMSLELAELTLRTLDDRCYGYDLNEEIRALLSAPVVERQAVAYVLTRDDEVCYEADDGVVISNTPGDETDLYKWKPVYFEVSPPAPVAVPEGIEWIRSAAKKWFYESFDCDLLELMEKHKLIAQAEGFSISVMADLELEMEGAFRVACLDKVKEMNG